MQDIKLEFSMATPFADSKILEEMTGKAVKAWQDLQDPQQEADVKAMECCFPLGETVMDWALSLTISTDFSAVRPTERPFHCPTPLIFLQQWCYA